MPFSREGAFAGRAGAAAVARAGTGRLGRAGDFAFVGRLAFGAAFAFGVALGFGAGLGLAPPFTPPFREEVLREGFRGAAGVFRFGGMVTRSKQAGHCPVKQPAYRPCGVSCVTDGC